MDDEALTELERLELAATPGPWRSWVEGRDHSSGSHFIMTGADPRQDDRDVYADIRVDGTWQMAAAADQDFIAAARNAVPMLIEEIRMLRSITRSEHPIREDLAADLGVHSRAELSAFIERMAVLFEQDVSEFSNPVLSDFLHSASSSVESMDQLYRNHGRTMPEQPTWGMLALVFEAARIMD